ncbi:MAG: peptidase dimerization domain-containing protein [Sandaracinaceae bacterium]|nr:peptidase dimerization domain-containing protein [Sandaracinaceae bacterium]
MSDEEVGSPSSVGLYRELAPGTEAALVFEAGRSGDAVVTRRKGGAVFELVAHGKATHAGNRHAEGVSAVHGLALLVPRLEALTDYARGLTVNVGVFEGGTAKNTVPERARLLVDARFVRGEDGPWLQRAMEALIAEPFAGHEGVPDKLRTLAFELRGGVTRPHGGERGRAGAPPAPTSATPRAAGLGIGEAPLQGGGSDANLLSAAGVPCIDGLGPTGSTSTSGWSGPASSLRRRTEPLATFLLERLPWDDACRSLEGTDGEEEEQKEHKREKREQEAAAIEAAEQAAARYRRMMRAVVIAIPLATLVAAGVTWAVTDDVQTAALVGLIGIGLWVPAILGSIGAAVAPRDRTKAGSIDFGQRR